MKYNFFPTEKYEVMHRQKCYKDITGFGDFFWMYGVKTGESLKDDGSYNDDIINSHYKNQIKFIRKTIEELGGTMPEDLPTPKKSLKELEKEYNYLNCILTFWFLVLEFHLTLYCLLFSLCPL